jgi:hypothetical protein
VLLCHDSIVFLHLWRECVYVTTKIPLFNFFKIIFDALFLYVRRMETSEQRELLCFLFFFFYFHTGEKDMTNNSKLNLHEYFSWYVWDNFMEGVRGTRKFEKLWVIAYIHTVTTEFYFTLPKMEEREMLLKNAHWIRLSLQGTLNKLLAFCKMLSKNEKNATR